MQQKPRISRGGEVHAFCFDNTLLDISLFCSVFVLTISSDNFCAVSNGKAFKNRDLEDQTNMHRDGQDAMDEKVVFMSIVYELLA